MSDPEGVSAAIDTTDVSGGMMITKLLTRWVWPDDKVQEDEDGACPACDHPFGQLNHACFGPLRTAS